MYTQKQLGKNAQNKHQRIQELEALTEFERILKRIYPKISIDECGLLIDDELPFLGASPFRLFGTDCILSIKCPLAQYKKNINEVKMQFWKVSKGIRTLNTKSAWYIEIQGELHVSKRKLVFLMIWLGESQYEIVKLKRDDKFFEDEMNQKLVYFYNEVMLKELANSRSEREMELRQYDEATKTFL